MSYLLKNPHPKNTMIAKISSSLNTSAPIPITAGSYKISLDTIIQTSTYGNLTMSSNDVVLTAGKYTAIFKLDLRTNGTGDAVALSYTVELRLNNVKVNEIDIISQSNAAPVDSNTSVGIASFTASNGDLLSMYVTKTASNTVRYYYQNLGGIVLIRTAL